MSYSKKTWLNPHFLTELFVKIDSLEFYNPMKSMLFATPLIWSIQHHYSVEDFECLIRTWNGDSGEHRLELVLDDNTIKYIEDNVQLPLRTLHDGCYYRDIEWNTSNVSYERLLFIKNKSLNESGLIYFMSVFDDFSIMKDVKELVSMVFSAIKIDKTLNIAPKKEVLLKKSKFLNKLKNWLS